MSWHTVALDGTPPQPWRNGGGRTRELLCWPTAAAWQVRVSVADIDRDGPFSAWPGVTRWFQVLAGQGVLLAWPGGVRRLGPADAPVSFAGDEAPGCTLCDGPTSDLNLMVRGGVGRVQRVEAAVPWTAGTAWHGLYAAQPGRLTWADGGRDVAAHTLLWRETASPSAVSFAPDAPPGVALAWWLEAAA